MKVNELPAHKHLRMRKFLIFLIVILGVDQLKGQPSITFQVNMTDLMEDDFFVKHSGDKVLLRGSFNNWQGSECELAPSNDSNIYIGKFHLGNIGDTISHKYVIKKGTENYYWENHPDPNNPNYGNRIAIITKNSQILPIALFSYDEYVSFPVLFSKEKLQEDYLQFRDILESTHPALYDYTPKASLDSLFDNNFKKINSELDFNTFLILMTEVISKVGCGHSSLWIPNKFWEVAPENLFPLRITVSNKKIFVNGSYKANLDLPIGSELIALNRQPMDLIMKKLAFLTSADGFNPSYRKTMALKNFAVKYAFAYGFFDSFEIDYKLPNNDKVLKKNIQPTSKKEIDKSKDSSPELSFKLRDQSKIGILTINSFGYYGEVEMFQNFVDSVFSEIRQNKTENLILDLRGNSGGDPFCAAYLWAYLEPMSLPYFEDHYGKYDTLANPIPKAQNSFNGHLFTLIDGHGFSTTGHFCGLLKFHKVGKFIGSELGSTYTCTGNATYPPLKNTGIMVGTARVRRYSAAVKNMDATRGVMPDYEIEPTQENIINGKDTVMDFAVGLAKGRAEIN